MIAWKKFKRFKRKSKIKQRLDYFQSSVVTVRNALPVQQSRYDLFFIDPPDKKIKLEDLCTIDLIIAKTSFYYSYAKIFIPKEKEHDPPFWNDECARLSSEMNSCDESCMQDAFSPDKYGKVKTGMDIRKRWMNVQNQYSNSVEEEYVKPKLKRKRFQKKDDLSLHEEPILRTKAIELKLDKIQKQKFDFWYKACNWTYNRALKEYKIFQIENNGQCPSIEYLRHSIVSQKSIDNHEDRHWLYDCPQQLRDAALCDVFSAYNTCFKNKRAGNIKYFNMTPRNKNTLKFLNRSYRGSRLHLNALDRDHQHLMGKNEQVPSDIHHDFRINKVGKKYYIYLPYSIKQGVIASRVNNDEKIVAFDFGVRTFASGYSPNGHLLELGDGMNLYITKNHKRIDKLKSIYSKVKNRKVKRRIKEKMNRFRVKLYNQVTEFHKKMVLYIVQNYNHVIICPLKIDQLIQGKMSRKTKRQMASQRHSDFVKRLSNKSVEYRDNKIHILGDEAYTSQCCSNCGSLRKVDKVYKCLRCGLSTDRDSNGAKNILLKYLSCHKDNLHLMWVKSLFKLIV